MPRRARLTLPGVSLHIIQRGNNRSACFYADEDYSRYLLHLKVLSERYRCSVHAYVLMTNHVHLLLTPEREDSASLLMKHLGQRYVQYVNRVYRRSGTLWEGRFRSCLIQSEEYLLACYRYIELNPVRAVMVQQPGDYRWSSYSVNALGAASELVTPHEQYLRIGRTDQARREGYRALFTAHLDAEAVDQIRRSTNGNYALGDDRFKTQIEEALGRRARPGLPGRPKQDGKSDDRQMDLV
jgi:putative transposase